MNDRSRDVDSPPNRAASPGTAVVIGGGVIGAATADSLSERGWRVTLVDSGAIGGACSHGNCGYVCPSHVLPLAEPGAIGQAIRAMLRPNSPLSIRCRFDPSLWRWLLRFAARCNRRDMLTSARAMQPLLESSMKTYRRMMAGGRFECEWEERGLLFVFESRGAMNAYAETDKLLDGEFGLPARRLDAGELTEFEPALKPELAGGWHYDHDAHLRPDRLMTAWRKELIRRGVTICEHRRADRFRIRGGEATAVSTDAGDLEADLFVIATGALAPQWQKQLGASLRIQPGKGYSMTMPRPTICPRTPMLLMEHRVGVTPFASGYRLGSTMEFAGYDTRLREDRLALLVRGARSALCEPTAEPIEEKWYGWRPMTPDGLPYIGRSPNLSNVWIAAGHNMLGLSTAPATGRLIAELASGDAPHIDPAPYRVKR